MHPAPSVIAFTTLSGLGFGFLAFLSLGYPDVTGRSAFAFYFVGYALAVGGLMASVMHLGNKRNAIKAFSQWRSSWLSREGIAAIATLCIVAIPAIARIFFDTTLPLLGAIGACLCLVTIFTTSMIYTQLKSVPRWHSPFTPVLFLGYALTGGALLSGPPGLIGLALWLLPLMLLVQIAAWMHGDGQFKRMGTSMESATGLGNIGTVRQLESAHSGSNYLLKEMAYQVGRKHAKKLRIIGLVLALILPFGMLLALPLNHAVGLILLMTHLIGMLVIRWLFFAEARHVVGLYYGR